MQIGEVWTFRCAHTVYTGVHRITAADVRAGGITGTATVTGHPPDSDELVTDTWTLKQAMKAPVVVSPTDPSNPGWPGGPGRPGDPWWPGSGRPGTGPGGTAVRNPDGSLAQTGGPPADIAAFGLVLLGLGAVLLRRSRQRA